MNTSRRLLALFSALALAASAHAITFSTNFDSASNGSFASAFNTADLSFHNTFYGPKQDEFGDDIPGSSQFQVDTASDSAYPVIIGSPSDYGYGAAPSGILALNVIDQSVMILFAYDVDISSFSVTLDNSSFGNLFATSIDFVNGTSTKLSQNIDQTVSGLVVNVGAVTGVRSIILPTTAFYDNLTINFTASASAVPEPSTYAALAGIAGLAIALARRRVKKAA